MEAVITRFPRFFFGLYPEVLRALDQDIIDPQQASA